MSTSAAAAAGQTPLDETTLGGLLAKAVASRGGTVRLVGRRLHGLASRLIADGVPVEATVPRRRDARALRRAVRRAGGAAPEAAVADIHVGLPCRLDPGTFPFPRRTVRELGRAIAPYGVVVLLPGDGASWPEGLVDAWAASAGLVPHVARGMGGALPFAGAVYESRS